MELNSEGLLALALDEALKDGEIDAQEAVLLSRLQQDLQLDAGSRGRLERKARERFEQGRLGRARPLSKRRLYEKLILLALADGQVTEKERKLVKYAAGLLDITPEEHQRISEGAKQKMRARTEAAKAGVPAPAESAGEMPVPADLQDPEPPVAAPPPAATPPRPTATVAAPRGPAVVVAPPAPAIEPAPPAPPAPPAAAPIRPVAAWFVSGVLPAAAPAEIGNAESPARKRRVRERPAAQPALGTVPTPAPMASAGALPAWVPRSPAAAAVLGIGVLAMGAFFMFRSSESPADSGDARPAKRTRTTPFRATSAGPDPSARVSTAPPKKPTLAADFFKLSEEEKTAYLIEDLKASGQDFQLMLQAKDRGELDATVALLVKLLLTKDPRMMEHTSDTMTTFTPDGKQVKTPVNERVDDSGFKEALLYMIRDNAPRDSPLLEKMYEAYKAESYPMTRMRIVRAIGKIGGPRSQKLLRKVVANEGESMSYAAQEAARRLSNPGDADGPMNTHFFADPKGGK
ncbi:MAG: hypothetical protein HY303_13335 [Candidatus Wallbacteria bacterium]|nr:hypothetical protein [Candidatus Wallbacteria bacterium]